VLEMAIEAIKGAGMVYQGSTSTAQIKEQAQGRTEVSSADNQVVSDSIARNIQAMNTKETSGDSAGDAGAQGQAQRCPVRTIRSCLTASQGISRR
jgi:flagellar protein FlaG